MFLILGSVLIWTQRLKLSFVFIYNCTDAYHTRSLAADVFFGKNVVTKRQQVNNFMYRVGLESGINIQVQQIYLYTKPLFVKPRSSISRIPLKMITKTFVRLQTHLVTSTQSCLHRVTMSEALKALSSADKHTVVNSDYLYGSTLGPSVCKPEPAKPVSLGPFYLLSCEKVSNTLEAYH